MASAIDDFIAPIFTVWHFEAAASAYGVCIDQQGSVAEVSRLHLFPAPRVAGVRQKFDRMSGQACDGLGCPADALRCAEAVRRACVFSPPW